MKDNLTEIVCILDRSGSMRSLSDATIDGYNQFIEDQLKECGDARVSIILFDDKYEVLCESTDIRELKKMNSDHYYTRGGMTALFDSIGKTIDTVGLRLSKTPEEDRPSKVVFLIITDGAENSSVEYSRKEVYESIKHQEEKYNWKFLFIGANIDSEKVGSSIGVAGGCSANYTASDIGTRSVYVALSKAVSGFRTDGEIKENWSDEIQ